MQKSREGIRPLDIRTEKHGDTTVAGAVACTFGYARSPRLLTAGLVGAALIAIEACRATDDGWRSLEVETQEVTSPDIAVSPDGSSIVFSLLGHLFLLPEEGGETLQLTFGPYFDARPAFSPSGIQLAFQSDRDGSEGNIFLLDVGSGEISQVTFEPWADSPAWAPDGGSLVYLRLSRSASGEPEATVRRVWLNDGRTETLLEGPGEFRSPFFLRDGRPGWAAVEWRNSPVAASTQVQVLEASGVISTLLAVEGVADALVPAEGEIYARRYVPRFRSSHVSDDRAVIRIPLDDEPPIRVTPVSVMGIQNYRGEPRFAWSPAMQVLYVGDEGQLLKISGSNPAEKRDVPFRARVEMEVRSPSPPPQWAPPASALPSGTLLITNVRVLDFEIGGFTDETSLLVQDGLISRIGVANSLAIPVGTDTLDAQGRFAIPGLFEMHGHMDWCSAGSYVEHGITSMRNLGAEWEQLRDNAAASSHAVPNCFFAGQIISGWDFDVKPVDEYEARALVRDMKAGGASLIKLHYTLPWPLARAAADEAMQLGLPVVRHVDMAEDIVRTVVLGVDPTHTTGQYEDLLELLELAQSRVDLTLQTSGSTAARRAYDAGVTIMLGTDLGPVPSGSDIPGPQALHHGFEALRDAGIPPLHILRMATLTAAETVGAERYLGSLEEGKVADIVLLNRNPLADIGNTGLIWQVLKAGFLVQSSEGESGS